MTNEKPDITASVLARIKGGGVSMRPRIYFILEAAGLAALALMITGITAFLANFMLFALDVEGHGSLLAFGARGLGTFVFVFPWGWLLLDLALIVLITVLVRRFRFGYRRSVLYVAALLLLAALLAGAVLERGTSLNAFLLDDADHDRLPAPIGNLYEGIHDGPPHELGVYRGIVDVVATSSFTMSHDDFDHDGDDGTLTVWLPEGFDDSQLSVGDRVYVAGTRTSEGVAAYGVRVLGPLPDGE